MIDENTLVNIMTELEAKGIKRYVERTIKEGDKVVRKEELKEITTEEWKKKRYRQLEQLVIGVGEERFGVGAKQAFRKIRKITRYDKLDKR